jgi:hypothetical protein
MDPIAKEKHEEEHEDSKKEREARTTSDCIENQPDMNSLKGIKQRN